MNLNHFVFLSDIIMYYNISNFNLYITSKEETWKTLFLGNFQYKVLLQSNEVDFFFPKVGESECLWYVLTWHLKIKARPLNFNSS